VRYLTFGIRDYFALAGTFKARANSTKKGPCDPSHIQGMFQFSTSTLQKIFLLVPHMRANSQKTNKKQKKHSISSNTIYLQVKYGTDVANSPVPLKNALRDKSLS